MFIVLDISFIQNRHEMELKEMKIKYHLFDVFIYDCFSAWNTSMTEPPMTEFIGQ